MNRLLIKMLVLPFYQAHAGFFILLFVLAFGFIRNTEHLAIATYFSANTGLLLLLMLIYWVYYLRTVIYIRNLMQQLPNFYWLQQFVLFPGFRQISWFWIIQLLINLPVLSYAAFIAVQGIVQQYWINVVIILVFNLLMVVLPAFFYRRILFGVLPQERQSRIGAWLSQQRAKPRWLWFPLYLVRHKPLAYLMSKLFSLLLIIAVFKLFHTDAYDWRLLAIGVFIAFYINGVLVYNKYHFENKQTSLLINLPLSFFSRILQQGMDFLLLSFPEIIVMVRYWPEEVPVVVLWQLILLGISTVWMLHQYMWHTDFNLEKIGFRDFFIFIAITIVLLFAVPVWFLILIFFSYSLWISYRWYDLRKNSI